MTPCTLNILIDDASSTFPMFSTLKFSSTLHQLFQFDIQRAVSSTIRSRHSFPHYIYFIHQLFTGISSCRMMTEMVAVAGKTATATATALSTSSSLISSPLV